MNRKHSLRSILIGILILTSTGCMAAQQDVKPTATSSSCPQIEPLLGIMANKNLFDQTADDFLLASKNIIKAQQDKTATGPSKRTLRKIKFAALDGQWMIRGQLDYELIRDKPYFEGALFVFSTECFKTPSELIELANKTFPTKGKYHKTTSPEVTETLYWSWKDPDVNMTRTLEISAAQDGYFIKASRAPDSKGVAD